MATQRPSSPTPFSSFQWIALPLLLISAYLFVIKFDPVQSPGWACTLCSVCLVAFSEFFELEYIQLTLIITVILDLCYWIRFGFLGVRSAWEIIGYLSLSGIAAIFAVLLRAPNGKGALRKLSKLYPALLLPIFFLASSQLHRLYPSERLLLRDLSLLEVDRMIGIAFSAKAGSVFHASALLAGACEIVYVSVTFWIVFGAIFGKKPRAAYWNSILVATLCGFLSYPLVPAVGPRMIWGADFPVKMTTFFEYSRPIVLANRFVNCMPSLHATWGMLIFWNGWNSGNKYLRLVCGAVLGMTVLATLGLGEHYVIDLVVAVPFAYAIHCATNSEISWRSPQRLYPVIAGAVLFLVWEFILKTGVYAMMNVLLLQAMVLLSMAIPASPMLWQALPSRALVPQNSVPAAEVE